MSVKLPSLSLEAHRFDDKYVQKERFEKLLAYTKFASYGLTIFF